MGVFQNNLMGAAAASASAGGGDFYDYQIAQSVRLNKVSDSSGGNFSKTFSGSPTNSKKGTFSTWLKRIEIDDSETNALFVGGAGGGALETDIKFDSGKFRFNAWSGSTLFDLTTSQYFRDPSAWYHLVVAWDTTQGTAADRVNMYVNGSKVTAFSTESYPSADATVALMAATENRIGMQSWNDNNVLGAYLAETYGIDGTMYAASDFGETKNGVWVPKDASGLTFGNNGFYLKYESSGDLGNDSSGNNNDWTANSMASHDKMLDSPTFNSDSNGGNFATYNPLTKGSYTDLSEGNLRADSNTGADASYPSGTFGMVSGKWYYEQLIGNTSGSYPSTFLVALNNLGYDNTRGTFYAMRYRPDTGAAEQNSGDNIAPFGTITVNTTGVTTAGTGDIVSWYVDMDNKKAWFAKNGSIPNSGDPANGTNPQFSWTENPHGGVTFGSQEYQSSYTTLNAGQDGTFAGEKTAQGNSDDTGYGNFYYDPPTGFLALCSGNLPTAAEIDPAETDDDFPQKLFGVLKYTGNGSERDIDTTFQIDKSWARSSIQGQNWYALDTTRGYFGASSNNKYMILNDDAQEATLPQYNFKAQSGSDITITSGSWMNSGSHTQIMWNWRLAGGTTATNSNGSLSSVTQVDPSGCISVGTYTANATNSTIGHGLSKKPALIILKKRDNQDRDWTAWHHSLSNTQGYVSFFENNAAQTDSQIWQNTAPTSTVFSVNYGTTETNAASGDKFLFHAFADCEGYIKIGKYIGNANADGTWIYTGFRPAFLMTRPVSSGDDPLVWDIQRSTYNPMQKTLSTHDASAEVDNSNRQIDFLSNGFKIRTSNSNANTSNSSGILFMAFADIPAKYATAK